MDNKPTLQQKGRYQLQYRGTECTNCGHPLDVSDKFCPNCSQANSTKKLSLKDFFDEFFASLISYDSKLLKTLTALLSKPGKITKDYIDGKRVSYTNPFRFLLSLSIIYFLIINYSGNYTQLDRYGLKGDANLLEGLIDLDINYGDKNDVLGVEITFDSIKEGFRNELNKEKLLDSLILSDPTGHFITFNDSSISARHEHKREFFETVIRKDSVFNFDDATQKYGIASSYENKFAFGASMGLLRFQKQPGSFLSSLVSKLPFATFFFLPVFSIFIWLVYIRKKYNYTDHLIFSFHNQSLLFILLIISFLVDSVFNIYSSWIFFIIFSIYLFLAIWKFYGQGVFKTIVKYLFLNAIFFILALFSMLFLFMGSMYAY